MEVVAERGVARASVELIIARSRISRRTFYERFASLDECLAAVMDRALERVSALAAEALSPSAPYSPWPDGMRAALASVLAYFDSDSQLARVLLVETLGGGPLVREHRERVVGSFRELVVARLEGEELSHASPLAPESALASVMEIARVRLTAADPGPLIELLGPLMGVLVGPFMDDAGIAREIERGEELTREMLARRCVNSGASHRYAIEVPDALLSTRAYRTRLCLLFVAEQAGSGTATQQPREVGEGIGVSHAGHVSMLLGKLAGLGLIAKQSAGAGLRNAWALTPTGERVARAIAEQQ